MIGDHRSTGDPTSDTGPQARPCANGALALPQETLPPDHGSLESYGLAGEAKHHTTTRMPAYRYP